MSSVAPVKRNLLDAAEPLSDEEREQLALQWVEQTYKRMTRAQQVYMEELLSRKRGGQKKWTPEALKTLCMQQQELQELCLSPATVKILLGRLYHLSEKRIANLLSEAKR